ncbi:hypothetical protein CXB51_028756 [Gossypium anomalum]|uniref:DDE Tnp4 domain-containing protein n=1 Tax=Gossypium anomalum TaxID=47600 RepID=A0A8J6CNK4_9ROSI|nr:hypothetical protein CXB51_028756 [Gossypium anomalum]
MLGVCTPDMQFVYVLPGWKGSVADGRVLRDAISRHGLKVPHGCYYLVDAGYTNCEGFLAPFRGQRYHLNEWRQGYQPSTLEEFFNMKHASARNELGEGLPSNVIDDDESNIINIHPSDAWATWRMELANQMSMNAKDRATGKDTQTTADIIEEINDEDEAATNTHEERNDFHGSEANVSLDNMDLSATQPQPESQPARNQEEKKISDASDFSTSFNDAAALLAKNIRTVGLEISKSIASEVVIQQKSEMTIQESALKLYPTLCEVEGLTEDERDRALSKISDHPTQVLIFFSMPSAM